MPKKLEDCVAKVSGTNKRTGKPYTQSEKYAICNSMMKKHNEGKAEEEVASIVENEIESAKDRLIQQKKVNNREEAGMHVDIVLTRYNYDIDEMKKII
jgi:hypothetical protein